MVLANVDQLLIFFLLVLNFKILITNLYGHIIIQVGYKYFKISLKLNFSNNNYYYDYYGSQSVI
jgi:hypothetical protein